MLNIPSTVKDAINIYKMPKLKIKIKGKGNKETI